ncbi:MAG: hypothetical protein OEV70_01010, partial [Nitrospirota bacterium]|nr:hypothetical protein [Nitrospirota bacterium]
WRGASALRQSGSLQRVTGAEAFDLMNSMKIVRWRYPMGKKTDPRRGRGRLFSDRPKYQGQRA